MKKSPNLKCSCGHEWYLSDKCYPKEWSPNCPKCGGVIIEEINYDEKLFKKAPDMLKTLKFINSWILDNEITREQIKKTLEQAIAKAEGK